MQESEPHQSATRPVLFDFVDEVVDEERREDETSHCSTETVARTSEKWSEQN